MGTYLMIESRDPFESRDSDFFADLAGGLRKSGHPIVLFLVQNGVFSARQGSRYQDRIRGLLKEKIRVVADRFSLKERAISDLVEGVEEVEIGDFVDLLMESGTKAIWH